MMRGAARQNGVGASKKRTFSQNGRGKQDKPGTPFPKRVKKVDTALDETIPSDEEDDDEVWSLLFVWKKDVGFIVHCF